MSPPFSRPRRLLIAFVALIGSGVLFRAQVADALVIRGDDYVYRGDRAQALERYRRAMVIAPSSGTAVDRYVFVSMQTQTPAAVASAIAVASGYLRRHPDDIAVRTDRALCYLHAHRYAAASADFLAAARVAHSSRYALYARMAARAERRT